MNKTVSVVNLTYNTTDRYGNPASSVSDEIEYPAYIEQVSTLETLNDRETRNTKYLLILPATADIDATSTVTYGLDSYRVNGKPHILETSRGPHHLEVEIELIEG